MERREFLSRGVASLLLMAVTPFGTSAAEEQVTDLRLPEPGVVPLSEIPTALERINDRRQVLYARHGLEMFLEMSREDFRNRPVDRTTCIAVEQALVMLFPERAFPRERLRVGVSGAGVGKFVFAAEFVVQHSGQITRVVAWYPESGVNGTQAERIAGLALGRIPLPKDLIEELEAA